MKTLGQIIAEIDRLKPNGFSGEEKTEWVNQLQGQLRRDVHLRPVGFVPLDWAQDQQTPLMLDESRSGLYHAWLGAQIDFHNGEYDKYQNSMEMFNAQWRSYVAWYCNTYHPSDGPRGCENGYIS